MTLDRAIIEGELDIIDRNLKFLQDVQRLTQKKFLASYGDIQATKHSLLEIVEACIDVANYVISVKGFTRAESYSEMFATLGRERVLEVGLAESLQEMAKFRDLLVHRYAEVDNTRVLKIVKHNLNDVREFERQIQKLIRQESGAPQPFGSPGFGIPPDTHINR